jgi:gas vesicle structural protein
VKEAVVAIEKSVASASIAEVVDRILDKGVVIDAFIRVSLVGIELIAIEIRAVVASIESWLKYAEAVGLTVDPSTA